MVGGAKRAQIVVPRDEKTINMVLPAASELRFPGPLISLEKISFRYGNEAKLVLKDIDLTVHLGDRMCIMGLNGSGKSTLIRILVDDLKPASGTISRHARLKLGYYSQQAVKDLQTLGLQNSSMTALSLVLADAGESMGDDDARGLLGSFGLAGRVVSDVSISKLSGGQLVSPQSL